MLANPPFLAHLSFRLGNQLFCVRVEDVDGNAQGPGTIRGLATAARHANGHACILPMKKKRFCDSWVADLPGWGLLNAATGKPINPVSLVTSEKIVMSPWEVHDVAVQVGRDYLQREGFEPMSWQGNPEVDPSIWFVGKTRRGRSGSSCGQPSSQPAGPTGVSLGGLRAPFFREQLLPRPFLEQHLQLDLSEGRLYALSDRRSLVPLRSDQADC